MIVRIIHIVVLIGLFWMAAACKSTLDRKDYIKWVDDQAHGLNQLKQVDEFTFELKYTPLEYVIAQRYPQSCQDKKLYTQKLNEIKGLQYYELSIDSKKGDLIEAYAASQEEINQRLYYFSFGFQNDITLQEGKKEQPCVLFHFVRSYDLKNQRKFLLGFQMSDSLSMSDKTIGIDSDYLALGKINITIKSDDLKKLPELLIQ